MPSPKLLRRKRAGPTNQNRYSTLLIIVSIVFILIVLNILVLSLFSKGVSFSFYGSDETSSGSKYEQDMGQAMPFKAVHHSQFPKPKRNWISMTRNNEICPKEKTIEEICQEQGKEKPFMVLSPWPSPVQFEKWPIQRLFHPAMRMVSTFVLDREPHIELIYARRTDNRISTWSRPKVLPESRDLTCGRIEEFRHHLCHNVLIPPYGGGDRACGGEEMVLRTKCPAYITTDGVFPGTIFDGYRWFQNDADYRPPDACESTTIIKHKAIAIALARYPHAIGHFPLQIMPRIMLLLRTIPKDVKILTPVLGTCQKFLEHLYKLKKLTPNRIIPFDPLRSDSYYYHAETVYFPLFTSFWTPDSLGVNMYQLYRDYLELEWPDERNDVVIIKRTGGSRSLVNYKEMIEALKEANIGNIVEFTPALTLQEDIDLFRTAYMFLGPHGAGMGNMIFMKPGSVVFELAYDNRRILPMPSMFYDLAIQVGHDYWLSVAPGSYIETMKADIPEVVKIAKKIHEEKLAGAQEKWAADHTWRTNCDETFSETKRRQ